MPISARRTNRKNFFPTVIVNLLFWGITGFMIIFVDPALIKNIILPESYLPFFISLFIALFLTLSLILSHTRRGFFVSTVIISYLFLSLKGLGNLVNAFLLVGLVITLEYYFSQKK
ncbi:hypothetical protein A2783_01460 [Microgenomates group bacterium RIFCSPHIGHO2_01_FULL_45_11]|nr:MAG: hypothetical protein A2783_01460 [Microgenomates group bacterium RIFCSPHIGHO2_01_FULL_45_11]